jgi:hypothetical protein
MLNAVKHLYPARKAPRRELRFFAEFTLSEAEGLRMTFREVLSIHVTRIVLVSGGSRYALG